MTSPSAGKRSSDWQGQRGCIEIGFEYLIPTRQAVCASRSAAPAHLSVIAMRSTADAGLGSPIKVQASSVRPLGDSSGTKWGIADGQRRRADMDQTGEIAVRGFMPRGHSLAQQTHP